MKINKVHVKFKFPTQRLELKFNDSATKNIDQDLMYYFESREINSITYKGITFKSEEQETHLSNTEILISGVEISKHLDLYRLVIRVIDLRKKYIANDITYEGTQFIGYIQKKDPRVISFPELIIESNSLPRGFENPYTQVYLDENRNPILDESIISEKKFNGIYLESISVFVVQVNPLHPFFNAIGSTSDPKINSVNWLRLWERYFGTACECEALQDNQGNLCAARQNYRLVGGHVVLDEAYRSQELPDGADCYLVPICMIHNNDRNNSQKLTSPMYSRATRNFLKLIGYRSNRINNSLNS